MAHTKESEHPPTFTKRPVFIANKHLAATLARLDNDRASLEAATRRFKAFIDAAETAAAEKKRFK